MSSGTFGGLDFQAFSDELLALPVSEVYPEIQSPTNSKWTGLLGNFKNLLSGE